MASTLIVSIFLPKTVSFTDPPKKDVGRVHPFKTHQRGSSNLVLPTRASELNLFNPLTPAATPSTIKDFFLDVADVAAQVPVANATDQHSSMPSESYATDWGSNSIYNQPRSRVAQLPSDNIIAFQNYLERESYQAERYPLRFSKRAGNGPVTSSFRARSLSTDRGLANQEWKIVPAVHVNGGLINALRVDTQSEFEADTTWIGTIGFPVDSLSAEVKDEIHDELQNEHQSNVVYCSDKDIDGHYKHYCKVVLWPIFHYQVPDHAKSKAYEDHSWEFYANVNRVFADRVIASYKKGDTIWIHDYHLLLVPRMIREKRPDAKIGFFLHTAFPSAEVFRCLARKKELLHGMLGADLIGFQCKEYTDHFLSTCAQILLVETDENGVQLEDYFVNVTHEPIGINPVLFERARRHQEVTHWIRELTEKYKGKKIIVARDKLDNVHGVRQKLMAYESFLETHPDMREDVVMIQIAASASEQPDLLVAVSDIVSRVDSLYSTLSHQPLIFLRQDLTVHSYLALLSVADVLMISSLREGMCLTAHDFVFCQDGQISGKKHGPVILSEFTGSAAVFEGEFRQDVFPTHLSINPWDNYGMSKAIKKALDMSDEEKLLRWRRLHGIVREKTGSHWAQSLQQALDTVHEEHHQRASIAVPRLRVPQLIEKYSAATRRLFIIDYEGTLAPQRKGVPFQPISPHRMLKTLHGLLMDTCNIVYIMSGRTHTEVEGAFRTLPVGLIAENGGYIRHYGQTKWNAVYDEEQMSESKAQVQPILSYYHERLEGSWIEDRGCSILLQYAACPDQDMAARLASECAVQINGADKSLHVRAVPVFKAVLIEMIDFSKGTAAESIFARISARTPSSIASSSSSPICSTPDAFSRSGPSPDFIMVAGDDREDEVVFRWANELGHIGSGQTSRTGDETPSSTVSESSEPAVRHVFTVTVGRRNTQAQATLEQGATSLLNVLDKLTNVSLNRALPGREFYQSFQLPASFNLPA